MEVILRVNEITTFRALSADLIFFSLLLKNSLSGTYGMVETSRCSNSSQTRRETRISTFGNISQNALSAAL